MQKISKICVSFVAFGVLFFPGSVLGQVVINEVAWMGSEASGYDEWIELANTTGAPVSLDGWQLLAEDGSPEVALSGEVEANDRKEGGRRQPSSDRRGGFTSI